MPDNNYIQGYSLGVNSLPANPYAQKGAIENKFPQIDCCKYYASVGYAVAADGLSATITPLTGNLEGDLRYYRVEVCDGTNRVAAELDLQNRSTPFVVNTSTLNSTKEWVFFFYGELGATVGGVGCGCAYPWTVCKPKGATGDTIPPVENWDNVKFLIKLDSTTDANYTLFPSEGVELSRTNLIKMQDYSTTGELSTAASYDFKLFAKKTGLSPLMTLFAASSNVVTAIAANVVLPFALSSNFVEVADVELETGVAGSFSGALSSVLTNEGVTPSISITIDTLVV